MAQTYSDTVRAEAMARVIAGETVSGVARDMSINRVTLQTWMSRAAATVAAAPTDPAGLTLKDYLQIYLSENLITLTAHARLYRDKDWLAEQPPETIMAIDRQLSSRFVSIMDRLDGRSRESGDEHIEP